MCPTQITRYEDKSVKEKTQLLVRYFQVTTISYQPALSLAQDTTAASPMSQSKVMAFIGLHHFRETAPTPNKYKHRHLQLIMVLLISPIALQIVVEIDSGQVMNKLVVWKSDTCTQD